MNRDFLAVFWKEWKEILPWRAPGGYRLRPLALVGLIGILLPLQMGAQTYFGAGSFIFVPFLSFVAVVAVVPDAFAGERERHTLETLLATRLPDHAILIGKLAACVSYGWLLSIIAIIFGLITVNAAHWSGHVLLYQGAATWLAVILFPALVGGAVASAGTLVCLHAATVRQAYQTLSFAMIVIWLGFGFGIPSLRQWFARNLPALSGGEVFLAVCAVLLTVSLILVLIALNDFQRSKLVLD